MWISLGHKYYLPQAHVCLRFPNFSWVPHIIECRIASGSWEFWVDGDFFICPNKSNTYSPPLYQLERKIPNAIFCVTDFEWSTRHAIGLLHPHRHMRSVLQVNGGGHYLLSHYSIPSRNGVYRHGWKSNRQCMGRK